MEKQYTFEPSGMEILMTEVIGNTLVRWYYKKLANELIIEPDDKVLDYCSGCGTISDIIARNNKQSQLVYADVSERWLCHAEDKLKKHKNAVGVKVSTFKGKICSGSYDKILVHFALHDFPMEYRTLVISQLVENLKPFGKLYIIEPINHKHGIQLFELINLLEHTKRLKYNYQIMKRMIFGEYVRIEASLRVEN